MCSFVRDLLPVRPIERGLLMENPVDFLKSNRYQNLKFQQSHFDAIHDHNSLIGNQKDIVVEGFLNCFVSILPFDFFSCVQKMTHFYTMKVRTQCRTLMKFYRGLTHPLSLVMESRRRLRSPKRFKDSNVVLVVSCTSESSCDLDR